VAAGISRLSSEATAMAASLISYAKRKGFLSRVEGLTFGQWKRCQRLGLLDPYQRIELLGQHAIELLDDRLLAGHQVVVFHEMPVWRATDRQSWV